MQTPGRKCRAAPCSRSERFSSGIRTTATAIYLQARAARESPTLCGSGANQHFHQALQDFNMALGFLQARTPSIKPMLLQKESMGDRNFAQHSRDALPQFKHVLRILQNRQPLAVIMGTNAFQSFEHFVSFQCDSALGCMRTRKHGAPNRMSVQDRVGIHAAHDGEMQQGFRSRPATAPETVSAFIHLRELLGRKAALVQARRSNGQTQRLSGNYRAKVSARPQNPSARIEAFSNFRQVSGCLRKANAARTFSRVRFRTSPAPEASLGFVHRHAISELFNGSAKYSA